MAKVLHKTGRRSKVKYRYLIKRLRELKCKKVRARQTGSHQIWETPGGLTFPVVRMGGNKEVSKAVLTDVRRRLRTEGIELSARAEEKVGKSEAPKAEEPMAPRTKKKYRRHHDPTFKLMLLRDIAAARKGKEPRDAARAEATILKREELYQSLVGGWRKHMREAGFDLEDLPDEAVWAFPRGHGKGSETARKEALANVKQAKRIRRELRDAKPDEKVAGELSNKEWEHARLEHTKASNGQNAATFTNFVLAGTRIVEIVSGFDSRLARVERGMDRLLKELGVKEEST